MKNIREYITKYGIDKWLFIRLQVKRQYGKSARILYRTTHLPFDKFESAMQEWYNLYQ